MVSARNQPQAREQTRVSRVGNVRQHVEEGLLNANVFSYVLVSPEQCSQFE